MPAVVVDQLIVRYGDLVAVDGATFTAEAGQVTTVLGPNGAGKTSTIEVCEGFRPHAGGHVEVLGFDPARDQRALSERMGVMLQEGGVYPSARVADTVRLYCDLYGRGVDPADLVHRVGLGERATATWRRLSGGEKQRLSLALALAARPEVAFLDEPTSGVDVHGRDSIRAIVRDLAADGCAVVLATHELDEAERLADRVVVFDRGRVVANGTLDELRGSRREIRLRTSRAIAATDLSAAVGAPVREIVTSGTTHEYVIDGTVGVTAVSTWLDAQGAEVLDLRAGGARLEDVFRHLTGPSADDAEDEPS